ncbi:MAG: ATP-binding protein [Deltaproteobacteria bacterium]|nr:ATP-binding protein [Deltaproteobacteria bacterium]
MGRAVLFDKIDFLKKAYAPEKFPKDVLNFTMLECGFISEVTIDENTLDLRCIGNIDGFGIIELFSHAIHVLDKNGAMNLINSSSNVDKALFEAGFFTELVRKYPGKVFFTQNVTGSGGEVEALIPITYVGYKGAERIALENAIGRMRDFSYHEDLLGAFSWMIGELADNAHTHSKGPCHILVTSERDEFQRRVLKICVTDKGAGIPFTLKKNPRFAKLSDEKALVTAFRPHVSGWAEKYRRGKGLSDVAALTAGSRSLLRVESAELGLFMNFSNLGNIERYPPSTRVPGTRFCIQLSDGPVERVSREEIDRLVEETVD